MSVARSNVLPCNNPQRGCRGPGFDCCQPTTVVAAAGWTPTESPALATGGGHYVSKEHMQPEHRRFFKLEVDSLIFAEAFHSWLNGGNGSSSGSRSLVDMRLGLLNVLNEMVPILLKGACAAFSSCDG